MPNGQHQITVNNEGNPYRFLITTLHEIAHLAAFEKFGRNIKPHGNEWKLSFQKLALPFLHPNVFPAPLLSVFAHYLKNPKASSDTDVKLSLALSHFDIPTGKNLIFELPEGSIFVANGRKFKKGKTRIKRIECLEVSSEKIYLFHPMAPIETENIHFKIGIMQNSQYAVIMAGGVGSRFWPVSTSAFPKQFHDILGSGKSLLQTTYQRLLKSVPLENILILTNLKYKLLVLEQLPELQADQVLLEPAMRNTAPCILYAALKIHQTDPNAVMIVAPSDHWIEDEAAFTRDVQTAFDFASDKDALITLGITPHSPNTGYGYIEFNKLQHDNAFMKVKRFTEKPDLETAEKFIASGNFLWNAGIFIWSTKSIISAFNSHQPDMHQLFCQGLKAYNTRHEQDFIDKNYAHAANISIDYAILEQAENVWVKPANFDWNDLGTWGSLYDKLTSSAGENALINAKTLLKDCSGNIIRTSPGKLVVAEGLENFIIVETEKSLLILPKDKEQEIKVLQQYIQKNIDASLT